MIQTMMRKTYNKPAMHVEVFTPQEFCAPCTVELTYTYDGSHPFHPSTKFYVDMGAVGSLDAYDYDPSHLANTFSYDNTMTINLNDMVYYFWAEDTKIAEKIREAVANNDMSVYNDYVSKGQAGQAVGDHGNNGGNHVIAGSIVPHSYKNNS